MLGHLVWQWWAYPVHLAAVPPELSCSSPQTVRPPAAQCFRCAAIERTVGSLPVNCPCPANMGHQREAFHRRCIHLLQHGPNVRSRQPVNEGRGLTSRLQLRRTAPEIAATTRSCAHLATEPATKLLALHPSEHAAARPANI